MTTILEAYWGEWSGLRIGTRMRSLGLVFQLCVLRGC